nr:HAMP domain-containing histidine kinase [Saprospiraceae bacterium]
MPILLGLTSMVLVLLFFSTDYSADFKQHWSEEKDRLIQLAANHPDSLSGKEAGHALELKSPFDPQLLIFKDGELDFFLSHWLSHEKFQPGTERLQVRQRENMTTLEVWSEGIGEKEYNYHLILPFQYEDPSLQNEFWEYKFSKYLPVRYTVQVVGNSFEIEPDRPVRSSLLKQLAGLSMVFLFLGLVWVLIRYSVKWYDELIINPLFLAIPALVVLAFRLVLELSFIKDFTQSIPLFQHHTPVWGLGDNLGYLLIDIGLIFSLSLLILNAPIRKWWGAVNPGIKALASVASYFCLLMMWMFFSYSVGSLINHSDINIDLEEVFKLDQYSFILLIGVMMYLLAVFFICLKVAELIENFKIPLANRVLALATAAILSLPIFLYADFGIPPFPFYLAVFLFFFLLDLFTEKKSPGYPWIAFWLLILSGFVAAMLFSFTIVSDIDNRVEAAAHFTEEAEGAEELDWYDTVDGLRQSGEMNYDYAIYRNGGQVWSSTSVYPGRITEELAEAVEGELIRLNYRSEMVFDLDIDDSANHQLVIGKYSADFLKPFSLFSYVFFILVLVTILLVLVNERFTFLPKKWNIRLPRANSLRRKIQLIIISLTLASFILVSVVTIFFFKVNTEREKMELLKGHYEYLEDHFLYSPNFSEVGLRSQLRKISNDRKIRIGYYQKNEGEAGYLRKGDPAVDQFPVFLPESLVVDRESTILLPEGFNRNYPSMEVILGPMTFPQSSAFFLIGQDPVYRHKSIGFTDFLSTLLNVYLFLFLLSGVLAFVFSEGITQPLVKLRESLNKIKLGTENEPLEWDNEDEIGVLIKDYNRIIKEINESVKLLAITEREVAWREMAKQVAHEIKNPLTPMKLSIQHLQFASGRDRGDIKPLIDRTSATLIEQIDNLSRIASEFSNFAKMPEAQNEKVNLNDVVRSAHDLFRNREDMNIELVLPIDDIYVFADKNYLIRVLTNLMKNSLQAIPMDRRGKITIKLHRKREVVLIQVEDNGTGIPEEMQDKVFKPNFTSKNSGTGLGLAISQNIVEAFHGRIFFETVPDEGTSFFVELPLMRVEGNLDPEVRVDL